MNKTKKILNVLIKAVTWLLVAFTVFMMIFTIVTVSTVDKNERSVFGFRFYIVLSPSMSLSENNKDMKVHFDEGDIVITKSLSEKDKQSLEVGDIISFISLNNDESYGKTISHMIHDRVTDEQTGKLIGFKTYGTNTGAVDEVMVELSYVMGEYAGKLPKVGTFFNFVQSTTGYIVCILVPFMLLILYNGLNVIRLFRKYKREQTEALQAERNEIEAEREETKRMMAELLALKAQLNQGGEGTPPAAPAESTVAAENATAQTVDAESESTDKA